jgi:hypothetical protein
VHNAPETLYAGDFFQNNERKRRITFEYAVYTRIPYTEYPLHIRAKRLPMAREQLSTTQKHPDLHEAYVDKQKKCVQKDCYLREA